MVNPLDKHTWKLVNMLCSFSWLVVLLSWISLLLCRQDQDRWLGKSGFSHPHPPCCPPPFEPSNEKIYEHPWSLLAPFPWETHRSPCTDFQECPTAWKPLLVGNSWTPLHCIAYKIMHGLSKTQVTRGQQGPCKSFCRLKVQLFWTQSQKWSIYERVNPGGNEREVTVGDTCVLQWEMHV